MQTKHVVLVCVCVVAISPSQVPVLCRNRKNMRWQTKLENQGFLLFDQRHLSGRRFEMASMLEIQTAPR